MEFKKFEQQIAETLSSDELGLDIQELINDIHGKKKKKSRFHLAMDSPGELCL